MSDPRATLERNTIRLLRLSQDPGDLLKGELINVSLDHPPKYVALSYTCGRVPDCEACTLHLPPLGQLKISKNLSFALSQLQNIHGTNLPLLWADQICINQDDLAEKNPQVAMMRFIYTQASEVWVCLGSEKELGDAQRALEAVEGMAAMPAVEDDKAYPLHRILSSIGNHKDKPPSIRRTARQYKETQAQWMALLSMWKQPWFDRLWVRQEVLLAETPVYHYGNVQFRSLEKLRKACIFQYNAVRKLFDDRDDTYDDDDSAIVTRSLEYWGNVSRAKELFRYMDIIQLERQGTQGRQSLLDVMRFTFFLQCSREADRVYAIYHLSTADKHPHFFPSYDDKDLKQLWLELAQHLLTDTEIWRLNPPKRKKGETPCPSVVLALPAIQEGTRRNQKASWVPDFGHYVPGIEQQPKSRLGPRAAQKFDYYCFLSDKYHAGGFQDFDPSITVDGFLEMKGYLVSKISKKWLETNQPSMDRTQFESKAYWKFVQEELVPWYLRCRTHAPIDPLLLGQGFVRSGKLTQATKSIQWSMTDTSNAGTFKAEFTAAVNACVRGAGGQIDTERFKFLADRELKDIVLEVFNSLLPFICKSAWRDDVRDDQRLLAEFTNGCVGWIPRQAELNDQVMLIQGAPFPVIIREVPGTKQYVIVGDAFIKGLMAGEGWPKDPSKIRSFVFK